MDRFLEEASHRGGSLGGEKSGDGDVVLNCGRSSITVVALESYNSSSTGVRVGGGDSANSV